MNESIPSSSETSTSDESPTVPSRRRRLLPRFGLRSLLVFGLLFSLAFGWVGKNLYQVRQEEAAIETLKRAGASIYVKTERGFEHHPATPYLGNYSADPDQLPSFLSRSLGVGGPLPVISVDLMGDDPTDSAKREALAALARFPRLESVGLHGPAFDDRSMESLANLPNLNGIQLSHTSVTGDGWKPFAEHPTFRHVSLINEDAGNLMAGLSTLKNVRSMQLAIRGLSREDVEVLASLPELTSLSLTAVTLEDDDVFVPLSEAGSIREFSFSSYPGARPLTQADVSAIARLPNVASLHFQELDVSHLRELESIQSLRILRLPHLWADYRAAQGFSAKSPDCLVHFTKPGGNACYLAGEKIDLEVGIEHAEKIREAWADDEE